jgi:hypothetical protein
VCRIVHGHCNHSKHISNVSKFFTCNSNGCCYRPDALRYHEPEGTLVLFGPSCNRGKLSDWPESLAFDSNGEPQIPEDLTPQSPDPVQLEAEFRRKRLAQRRRFGPRRGDVSDDDGSESDSSDDGSKPVGFHFAQGCTHRCILYHNMVWLRHEIARRVRRRILEVMKNEDVDHDVGRDFVLDVVVSDNDENENELTKKYNILPELRKLTNRLLELAKDPEFKKKGRPAFRGYRSKSQVGAGILRYGEFEFTDSEDEVV